MGYPADRRHEFIIVFVDCYSQFTILVPASNYTADTVSDALLRHVVPYFGTPRRLLSDRGREFVGDVWGKLTSSLGIQRVLTSPYHPEGNSINERSHRTMNNMLRARLLRDLPSRKWVVEIPGIMLALDAMVHEPHGFSASMIATGREPSLPPDLESEACASPSTKDPVAYVEMVRQRLALIHQQMTLPPAPETSNPYHEGDLIFVMTTPPERTSKLEGPLCDKKGSQRLPGDIRGRHGLADGPRQPCQACQSPNWRLSCPYVTSSTTLTASHVPLKELYMGKAN